MLQPLKTQKRYQEQIVMIRSLRITRRIGSVNSEGMRLFMEIFDNEEIQNHREYQKRDSDQPKIEQMLREKDSLMYITVGFKRWSDKRIQKEEEKLYSSVL